MAVTLPTQDQLRRVAERIGFELTDDELDCYRDVISRTMPAYQRLDQIPDYLPEVKYPRTPGYRPSADENPYNAWLVKTEIKGASRGILRGKRIVVKDTVCVAGVPMMNGASFLEGYVPETDATVVTRILDAGGEIAGKAVCEFFSASSGSHTSATGMVENPVKPGHTAGGSSSGCAALVAAGEVDMAIGGDQAGSVRIPAAHCGLYGLKPTYGLVPYTGIMSSEFNVDHAGPITADVANNALLLEAIAGPDGIDTRLATPNPKIARYTQALEADVSDLTIGIVTEGFGQPNAMLEVDETVRHAAGHFVKLGVETENVSIPWHRDAMCVWLGFGREGYYSNMMLGNGFGTNHGGLYLPSLSDRIAQWRSHANEIPHNLRVAMIMGEHVRTTTNGHYYGKARNLVRRLREAYDEALGRYDLLLMPTVTRKAQPLPAADASPEAVIANALTNTENTCPFDLTHHPAISIPCGMVDGCPIGLMLVAKHWDESTIYRAAAAFERSVDWRSQIQPRRKSKRRR